MPKRVKNLKERLTGWRRYKKIVSQLEVLIQEELEMPGLRIRSIRGCDAEVYGGMIPVNSTMYYCLKKGIITQNYCKDSD